MVPGLLTDVSLSYWSRKTVLEGNNNQGQRSNCCNEGGQTLHTTAVIAIRRVLEDKFSSERIANIPSRSSLLGAIAGLHGQTLWGSKGLLKVKQWDWNLPGGLPRRLLFKMLAGSFFLFLPPKVSKQNMNPQRCNMRLHIEVHSRSSRGKWESRWPGRKAREKWKISLFFPSSFTAWISKERKATGTNRAPMAVCRSEFFLDSQLKHTRPPKLILTFGIFIQNQRRSVVKRKGVLLEGKNQSRNLVICSGGKNLDCR